ncbi:hypothetical protein [Sphingomonas sp. ERG5]|uniref:hypothetical protein n=1 Tax=Sphingomonas sp. ERG5 TaxID=1381597 RepID=UPI00126A22CF|nr:hypothetical protein [Sphingomonas sp. ERG5]
MFWTVFFVLLLFYAVCFALLAFLPDWWWLLPFSIVALIFCFLSFRDAASSDGPGSMLATPTAIVISGGFALGFVARAIILGARIERKILQALVLFVVFITGPALAYGALALEESRNKAKEARWARPSAACLSRTVRCGHRTVVGKLIS